MSIPRYGKRAPTEEAHQAAIHLRKELFHALEAAMDNDWARVEEMCLDVVRLAEHCATLEKGARNSS